MTYAAEVTRAMAMLAQDERTIFIGQAVRYPGTSMFTTLVDVPEDRRIEFPVAENMQVGVCIGLALQGYIPVCIVSRWNFLLAATDQIVNHLDKLPLMGWRPKVIIRTGIGSERPLHPGPQHVGDYIAPFRVMCPNITFSSMPAAAAVVPAYERALQREGSTVLVENMDAYN